MLASRDAPIQLPLSSSRCTLKAGGVGGLKGFLHSISVARKVMELTPHVLLVGEEVGRFASRVGFRRVKVRWKKKALETWRALRSKLKSKPSEQALT